MARKIRSKEIMSAEQLAEIGSIALESTQCEVIVEEVLWALAGLDHERGIHFTQNMQMKSRLELLTTLGRSRLSDEPSLNEFNALVEELKDLNTKRNHVIHGSWGAWITLQELIKQSGPNLSITPKAMKRRPNKPPVELSADQLKGLPEQIAQATKRLIQFAEKTWPAIL
jgi:hypothetical protein